MTVLIISVETSDQMGKSEEFVVGVFNDDLLIRDAKLQADNMFPTRRTAFRTVEVEPNHLALKRPEWSR